MIRITSYNVCYTKLLRVSLLSGDQEVDLAKRIEDGEILIERAVINSALLVNELIKNHSKVVTGKIKLIV